MSESKVPTHTALWNQLTRLQLEPDEVARRADLELVMVQELETDDSIEGGWALAEVKRLAEVLRVSLLDVLQVDCAYCGMHDKALIESGAFPRDALIKTRRAERGMSKDELFARAGWSEWFDDHRDEKWAQAMMCEYEAIEDGPDRVDELCFADVRTLAEVLRLPLHLLLGVRCPACGR